MHLFRPKPVGPLARSARSPVALAYTLLILIVVALFGRALIGSDRLAFRDASHFYAPLYRYLAAQERERWLPLYNPLDVTGIPLAGETTTALFYPLRRVVYGLAPSAETGLAWYVVLHLLVASLAVHYATTVASVRPQGRALAVLAYPLSGPILFLYCNPPFLVGAAWVPLALGGGFALLRRPNLRDLTITSIGLAMPILGGDPQISLHAMLIGTVAAACQVFRGPATSNLAQRIIATGLGKCAVLRANALLPSSLRVFGTLAAAAGLSALLACPQLAASLDWAGQSIRYSPLSAQHAGDRYAFSVAPWHWLELALPRASGQLFPVYTRISHLITDDGKTWALTLYAGLLPLALSIARFHRRPWRRMDLWDYLAPLSLAMALGSFGVGYALRAALPQLAFDWDDATGGPYWWLVKLVPGYSGFRYPAKWLVFLPLGIAVCAARQMSGLTVRRRRQLAQIIFAIAAVASATAVLIAVGLHQAAQQVSELFQISDPFWGPLQWQTATQELAVSALAVNTIAAAAFWFCHRPWRAQVLSRCLVALVAIDLAIVAWPTVATVSRAAEARLLQLATRTDTPARQSTNLDKAEATRGHRAMRFVRGSAWPVDWQQLPSTGQQRMLTVEASQRYTRYGRWHLMVDQAVFNPVTSLPPHRAQSFWRAANGLSRQAASSKQSTYWDRLLGWLAIDQRWDVGVTNSGQTEPVHSVHESLPSLQIQPVRSPSPHVLWVPYWRVIDEQRWVSPITFAKRLREVTSDSPAPPLIEVPKKSGHQLTAQVAASDASGDVPPDSSAGTTQLAVLQASPECWTIQIDSTRSGLLCIKQFQDGNWRATIRKLDLGSDNTHEANADSVVPVYRCDYLFSALPIPAGRCEVILSYEPQWVLPSLAISGLAWAFVLVRMCWPSGFWPRRAMVCPAALG